MKLDSKFPALEALIQKMGAPQSAWSPDLDAVTLARSEFRAELVQGIKITWQNNEDLEVGPCNLLLYKGEQVLLYIPELEKKFHVADCKTLTNMRDIGRFERYVVTNRTDGIFKVMDFGRPTESPLDVCKNCLEKIDWKNYADSTWPQRKQIFEDFDISDFLFEYTPVFQSRPDRRAEDILAHNSYAKNWPEISQAYRERRNWICECKGCEGCGGKGCGADLSGHRKLLHTHHKSGVISDNSDANLMALCLLCHASQPMHGHMKVKDEYRWTIEGLRNTRQQ